MFRRGEPAELNNDMPFILNPNAFSKCAPALSTNIKQCGTVTQCNAIPMTTGDLEGVFTKSNDYRVMGVLFKADLEIRQCEAVQNGLHDFLMANKVNLAHKIKSDRMNSGEIEIAPFIMMRQYSPINDEYWNVSAGQASGANWQVVVTSNTNIPYSNSAFIVGQRVYIDGITGGGSKTMTAFTVVSATDNGNNTGTLVLAPQNDGSQLPPIRLVKPITGLLRRGTNNVNGYEKFCHEGPSYLTPKNVPSWVETTRWSMCKSSLYDNWRKLALQNPLYREFGDLPEIEKNRQLALDFQKRLVNAMFFNKRISNFQYLTEYTELDPIETYDGSVFGLGTDGSRCVGRRANAIGVIEQLADCNRLYDAQGAQLNLPALFVELYNIMRVREANGHKNPKSIDMFTDSSTAALINLAMLSYYKTQSAGMLSLQYNVNEPSKKAEFGFMFRSYNLIWPPGVTINVITHYFFDDYLAANQAANQANAGRVLWILDFSGIYPGVLASRQKILNTGDAQALAAISPDFACVMDVPTRQQKLTEMTYTMVVECPASNLIIENFSNEIPEPSVLPPGLTYPATTTTTTSTTQTFAYWNTDQSYKASCPAGTHGEDQTVFIPAGTIGSTVSVNDANEKALAIATQQAQLQLECSEDK